MSSSKVDLVNLEIAIMLVEMLVSENTEAKKSVFCCCISICFIITLKRRLIANVWCFAELEKKFKTNEQRMQQQRTELDELHQNATQVHNKIRDQVKTYSSCQ